MTGAKEAALKKALSMLNAIGAQYKIIVDGEEFGELEVIRNRRSPNRNSFVHIYRPVLESMKVGDCRVVETPEGADALALRRVVAAWACTNWGAGASVVVRKGDDTEVLRVA